jgi:hypothetical protein
MECRVVYKMCVSVAEKQSWKPLLIVSQKTTLVPSPNKGNSGMPWDSGDDLWNTAFSNVGRRGGQRRSNNDVARAIQAISGITATSHRSNNVTGE